MWLPLRPATTTRPFLRISPLLTRQHPRGVALPFALRRCLHGQNQQQRSFFDKLQEALRNTKTEWYAIPFGLGAAVVGYTQLRKSYNRREEDAYGAAVAVAGSAGGSRSGSGSGKRGHAEPHEKQIKPMGSWQVQVLSTLPLKALSYYWGRFNEIPLPRFLRVPGFKLYSWIFGVNLDEVEKPLEEYRNLAEFFYRNLKPGARPIDPRPNVVVSPADGKVLQFGEVRDGGEVEQVKGMTYSLDALLGEQTPIQTDAGTSPNVDALVKKKLAGKVGHTAARYGKGGDNDPDAAVIKSHEEFANVNGISYTLPSLLSGSPGTGHTDGHDASTPASTADALKVVSEVAAGASSWFAAPDKRLFFCVIYLAPGDYHHFHSPVSWVVEQRRHFAGELYSVSPWLQSRLKDLFVLNERVVLLGRWRYGMFSMTPVGATNVGSIVINFDRELRTNSFTHDSTAASAKGGFAEATYKGASALLGGYPIVKGEEMGGFKLGSTVVLVFEAPATCRKHDGPPGHGGFRWSVEKGQKVKVGQAIGIVEV